MIKEIIHIILKIIIILSIAAIIGWIMLPNIYCIYIAPESCEFTSTGMFQIIR